MHLKVLITFFQKMIWSIGVWTIVYDILAIKLSFNFKKYDDSEEI